jgi:gamma-glutamylaminecyclotransferase
MKKEKHLVFVYGTLRSGGSNYDLMRGAELYGRGETAERFHLTAGRGGVPFVSRRADVSPVKGEVYVVDGRGLARLDMLEGHPRWYQREVVHIRIEGSDQNVMAWIYLNERSRGEDTIADGDFSKWLDARSCGAERRG